MVESQEKNKAILVTVEMGKVNPEETREHLEELAFLAETLSISTVRQFVQKLPHADMRTYVGKGKFNEIKEFVFQHQINFVIFDDDLSPSQLKNIFMTGVY